MGRDMFVSSILHPNNDLVIAGPCALTEDEKFVTDESQQWADFSCSQLAGLADQMSLDQLKQQSVPKLAADQLLKVYRRMNFWKPRTNPNDWHGLETGSLAGAPPEEAAELAYKMVHDNSTTYANSAFEVSFPYQVERYGRLASFVWLGARLNKYFQKENGDFDKWGCDKFIRDLARSEPTLPVGIKNDLDGDLNEAINRVRRINKIRAKLGMACVAPAVLIYRGGNNATTEDEWYKEAEHAIRRTKGKVIIDVAHMSEMACHPDGKFIKSEAGQKRAWELVAKLAGKYAFVGIMTESSDMESPMDPPMSIEETQMAIRHMLEQRNRRLALAA
jgi:3-deoxy-D-arabino-heptulosonate 7-phosphate (DAHP) synthase